MEQEKKVRLQAAGMDVDRALERLVGNETLLERFLQKFLESPYLDELTAAIQDGDVSAAADASHALKGVSGNLSMITLFELLTTQLAAFRAEKWQKAVSMMPEITCIYEKLVQAIKG